MGTTIKHPVPDRVKQHFGVKGLIGHVGHAAKANGGKFDSDRPTGPYQLAQLEPGAVGRQTPETPITPVICG